MAPEIVLWDIYTRFSVNETIKHTVIASRNKSYSHTWIYHSTNKIINGFLCLVADGQCSGYQSLQRWLKWGTWNQWSSCDVTCGIGNQTTTRGCYCYLNQICVESTFRQCNLQPCPGIHLNRQIDNDISVEVIPLVLFNYSNVVVYISDKSFRNRCL